MDLMADQKLYDSLKNTKVFFDGNKLGFGKGCYRFSFGNFKNCTQCFPDFYDDLNIFGEYGFVDFQIYKSIIPVNLFSDYWCEGKLLDITLIGVEPFYRRKGVGREILKEVEKFARSRFCGCIKASSLLDENAESFFRKLNYSVVDNDAYKIL
jgi:GNAT superfamily N-acetyltransferase